MRGLFFATGTIISDNPAMDYLEVNRQIDGAGDKWTIGATATTLKDNAHTMYPQN